MRTQVAIVGGGPAGMLLSEMLSRHGIDSVVLERSSRAHVLARIRAGVLEQGTVDVLRELGLAGRLDREGHTHDGVNIVWAGRESFFIDVAHHAGRHFTTYGQARIQEDLCIAADRRGAEIISEVEEVELHDFHDMAGARPWLSFRHRGALQRLHCDFIAGCDGFHGVARGFIPSARLHCYEKVYPFGWLGVLSPTPPLPEIAYANHPRGFALASARSPTLSRWYIQVPLDTRIEDWPDERFWPELKARFPPEMAAAIVAGPSLEKSITPLRSFVAEPMQHGRLFLAGDAAHIVPPTGAKGLNLAVSDVVYLSRALAAYYADGGTQPLEGYGQAALRRVWSAVRVSWYLTTLLHRFPGASDFDQRAQEYELEHLRSSLHAQRALAEQYAGLPI